MPRISWLLDFSYEYESLICCNEDSYSIQLSFHLFTLIPIEYRQQAQLSMSSAGTEIGFSSTALDYDEVL